MGQKTHPTGFRIAITEQWRSRWYASKKDFSKFVVEDFKIRKFIRKEWAFAAIPKVEIERTGELVTVFLHTARPGILIGKKGAKVDKFREDLEKLTGKPVRMKIIEVHRPELEANLVAEGVAEQLSKRINYRRALKKVAETSMAAGIKASRSEWLAVCKARKWRALATSVRGVSLARRCVRSWIMALLSVRPSLDRSDARCGFLRASMALARQRMACCQFALLLRRP